MNLSRSRIQQLGSNWVGRAAQIRRGGILVAALFCAFGASANPASALNVSGTTPVRYDLGVSPDLQQIWVFFNGPLNTVSAASVRVAGSMSGLHTGQVSTADNVIIFTNESGPYFSGEIVHVNIRSDVQSLGGGASLTGGYYFAFTIASAPAMLNWSARVGYGASNIPYFIHGGDLNGDGDPDVAAPNEGTDDVSIFLNQGGAGLFPVHDDFGVGNKPSSIFGEDFDNDGDQDLATADIDGGTVTVLKNNGNGTFTFSQTLASGVTCRQIHGGDFDGDNDVDLCSTAQNSDRVYLFYNNGDGTYPAGVQITTVSDGPFAIRAGDFNGDGHLDIGVACQNADQLSVLTNNGTGGFSLTGTYLIGDGPWCLNGNDMDGDGDFDLCSVTSFSNRIVVLFNNGTGGFPVRHLVATGSFPLGVYVADLDGDGDVDAASSNYSGDSVGIYRNPGTGLIALQATLLVHDSGSYTWAHDLDRDGDLDLSVVDENADSLFVFYNQGSVTGVDGHSDGPRVNALLPILRVQPNPTNAAAGATVLLENFSGAVSVDLIGLDGRRLRPLWSGVLSGERFEMPWDGRGADGQSLSRGRYWISVETAGRRLGREVLLVP